MHHSVDGFVMFGLLLAGLCLSTFILHAAWVLFHMLSAVSLGSRARQVDHAGTVEAVEKTRRSSTLDGIDPSGAEDADPPGGVPRLDYRQAFAIIFATAMFNGVAGFLISRLLHSFGMKPGGGPLGILPVAHWITLPLSILVMGAMLPTRFGKGLLVALLYLLISLALGSVVLAVFFLTALGSAGLSG